MFSFIWHSGVSKHCSIHRRISSYVRMQGTWEPVDLLAKDNLHVMFIFLSTLPVSGKCEQ